MAFMKRDEVLVWVGDPARTEVELRKACVAAALPHTGDRATLTGRLVVYISGLAAGADSAIDMANLPAIPVPPPPPARHLSNGVIVAIAVAALLLLGALLVGSAFLGSRVWGKPGEVRTVEKVVTQIVEKPVEKIVVATPNPSSPAQGASSTAGGAVSCMTDSDVMSLFGFGNMEIVRTDAPWDSCKWTRQNAPSTINFTLPERWGLTYTDAKGQVWVTLGKGQFVTARGFTLRQPGNQVLVKGAQGYFEFEWTFGYAPERGSNVYPHCPDENMVAFVMLSADQSQKCASQGTKPASSGAVANPTVVSAAPATCQSYSKSGLVSSIGGTEAGWTVPDWADGAWKFHGAAIAPKAPSIGWIEVWDQPNTKITPANINLIAGKKYEEFVFHCK